MMSYITGFFNFEPPRGASSIPTDTTGTLYIGCLADALNLSELVQNRIALIVNTAFPYGSWPYQQNELCLGLKITLINFPLKDFPNQVLEFQDMPLEKIHYYLTNGQNVLVHCEKGISRSVSVAMAYLMRYHNYSCNTSLEHIRISRKWANPNPGFMSQLYKLEASLKR